MEYTRYTPFEEFKPRRADPLTVASVIFGLLITLFVGGIVVLIIGAGVKSAKVKVICGSLMGASVLMYLVIWLMGYIDKNNKSKLQRISSTPLMERSVTLEQILPDDPDLRYAVANSASVRNLWTMYLKTNDPELKKRWLAGTKREADKFYDSYS